VKPYIININITLNYLLIKLFIDCLVMNVGCINGCPKHIGCVSVHIITKSIYMDCSLAWPTCLVLVG